MSNRLEIKLPNRFESLIKSHTVWPSLICAVDSDLDQFAQVQQRAITQNGGTLSFVLGTSGVGKTTAVYSASVHLSDRFRGVLSVPDEVELRDILDWVREHLQPSSDDGKVEMILLDGREQSDDELGLKQLLSGLNQLLRKRADISAVWPVTDPDWHGRLRGLANDIGGRNFVPRNPIKISGPPKTEWGNLLDRLLASDDHTVEDLAIDNETVSRLVSEESVIGDFLVAIRELITERVNAVRADRGLPTVSFLVSAGTQVAGEANRIRKAGTLLLRGDELTRYSPQSQNGRWWKERARQDSLHLGYVISLFSARLFTFSPAAVAYSLLHFGPDEVRQKLEEMGLSTNAWNRTNAIRSSDFVKSNKGIDISEMTSSKKGVTSSVTSRCYDLVQSMSAKRHKEINVAVGDALRKDAGIEVERYEESFGNEVFADAILSPSSELHVLEFHYLSEKHCQASKMANYIRL